MLQNRRLAVLITRCKGSLGLCSETTDAYPLCPTASGFSSRNARALSDYLSRYGGVDDWHFPAFQLINDKFPPRKVLYPGSWIHLTPSLVFPHIVYVDAFSKMETAFNDSDLLQYIEQHSTQRDKPKIEFHQADYRSSFGEEWASFDLLISLSSGFVSQSCGSYLKEGGVFFTNDEHYDASIAYTDPRFKLIGVFKTQDITLNQKKSSKIISS